MFFSQYIIFIKVFSANYLSKYHQTQPYTNCKHLTTHHKHQLQFITQTYWQIYNLFIEESQTTQQSATGANHPQLQINSLFTPFNVKS